MPIQPYRSMSDSVSSGAIEHNLGKNSLINSLFQPTLRLISASGSKSALDNWTILAFTKEAKLDPKNRTVLDAPKRPQFRA